MESDNQVEVLDASPEDEGIFLPKETYEGLKKKAAATDIFYDKLLRLQAEFENYKKFTERQKTDLLNTEALFYEGTLWLVDERARLTEARLGYIEGKVTLIVTGRLDVDPDVAPKALVDHLLAVHNLGLISGTADQIAALEFLLGASEGDLHVVSTEDKQEPETEEQDAETYKLGNVINLKL